MTAALSQTRTFPARAQALAQVLAFVDGWCAAAGSGREPGLLLRLLAEELFLNCVHHGYRGAQGEVALTLADAGGELELAIEDGAGAFDPFSVEPAVSDSSNAADRPVGKLGLPLVLQFSSRRSYCRRGERNCVSVAVRRE